MRYVSLFSGIEAASVAWGPLGWEPVAFADIEPFTNEVLRQRFPDVPNLGDVSKIDWSPYAGTVDLVVGGSPCQAFSIAGNRGGLLDERGQLMLEYVRAVHGLRPRWVLWENVPGVLSQSNGDAFDTLQRELEQCGYSVAWRTIDAQFAGVAQRRRRVFLVGHARAGCAAAVLFERESLRWDRPSSKRKRQALAEAAGRHAADAGYPPAPRFGGVGRYRRADLLPQDGDVPSSWAGAAGASLCYTLKMRHTGSPNAGGGEGAQIQDDVATTLATSQDQVVFCVQGDIARGAHFGCNGAGYSREISYTLNTMDVPVVTQRPVSAIAFCIPAGSNTEALGVEICPTQTSSQEKMPPVVCISGDNTKAAIDMELAGTLHVAGSPHFVMKEDLQPIPHMIVRRLTPTECERLQGFPDGWTQIPYKGKPASECPDGPRYKACGNSMAVPVMRWIGRRIQMVEDLMEAADA